MPGIPEDKDIYRRNSRNQYKKPRQLKSQGPSKVRKALSNCWGQGLCGAVHRLLRELQGCSFCSLLGQASH